ncbi:MAG: hypothetical protein J6U54_05360 [Clostridiales bacterium]|nr:hypothetical protein [Clostridiales bacterium]
MFREISYGLLEDLDRLEAKIIEEKEETMDWLYETFRVERKPRIASYEEDY